MALSFRCSLCWETKCDHWSHTVGDEKYIIEGIFDNYTESRKVYHFSCNKCKQSTKVIPRDVKEYYLIQCICKVKCSLLVSDLPEINIDIMRKNKNCPIPCRYCLKCKGSKTVNDYTFIKCNKCDGMGGMTCTGCNITGIILKDNKLSKCSCDNGYVHRCTLCKGTKVAISKTDQIECNGCY